MMKILCAIGIHHFREVEILRAETNYSTLTLDGDVCERCGILHKLQVENARECLDSWRLVLRGARLTVHPAVMG